MQKGHLLGAVAAAYLGLALGGCQKHEPGNLATVQMHHLKSGRYVFHDDTNGLWYWYMATTPGGSPTSGTGSWQTASAPSAADLADEIDQFAQTITEAQGGAPAAGWTGGDQPAEVAQNAAGGDSLSVAGPTAETPSVPAEASAPAADTGGGGGGGGGGDAGGGGGGE